MLDNNDSVKKKIADHFNTLSDYFYGENIPTITELDGKDIILSDILSEIKNNLNYNKFNKILNKYKKIQGDQKIDFTRSDYPVRGITTADEIIKIWSSYYLENLSKDMMNNPEFMKMGGLKFIEMNMGLQYKDFVDKFKYFSNKEDFDNFLQGYAPLQRIEQINQFIVFQKSDVKNLIKINKEIEQLQVDYQHTNFIIEKAQYNIELELENMTLLEIFNSIILKSENIPYVQCKDFYKILKDFDFENKGDLYGMIKC
jgi:hypothetical protein